MRIHTEGKNEGKKKEIMQEDAHLQWAGYFALYFTSQNIDNNANKCIYIKTLRYTAFDVVALEESNSRELQNKK